MPYTRPFLLATLILIAFVLPHVARAADGTAPPGPPVSFKRDVAPVLLAQCQTCHGPDKAKGKYRLDSFDRLTKPGSSGDPAVTPGRPDRSAIYTLLVAHDPDERMPQKADPLPAAQVDVVRRWIEQGAAFDGPDPAAAVASYVEKPAAASAPAAYRRPIPVAALSFAPGGGELIAGGYHELTRWDARTGKLVGRVPVAVQRVQSIAVDAATGRIAVAGGTPGVNGELLLIDNTPGNEPPVTRSLEKTADLMLVARFSPDGTRLAAGGSDGAVRVYDVTPGSPAAKRLWKLEPHADWVTDLGFSPDGTLLVTASRDKSCRVLDTKSAVADASYPDHPEPVFAVAFAADGKTVFSAGRDRKLHAWSAADGKGQSVTGGFGGDVLRLARVGTSVWSAGGDGKLREHAADRGVPPPATAPATPPTTKPAAAKPPAGPSKAPRVLVRTLDASDEWVYALAASERAGLIAAGSQDGTVRVWTLDSAEPVTTFVAAPGFVP